jgi:hypothetical protein
VDGSAWFREFEEGKASQLWKERFPTYGSIDIIKLENKKTGTCLGDDIGRLMATAVEPTQNVD